MNKKIASTLAVTGIILSGVIFTLYMGGYILDNNNKKNIATHNKQKTSDTNTKGKGVQMSKENSVDTNSTNDTGNIKSQSSNNGTEANQDTVNDTRISEVHSKDTKRIDTTIVRRQILPTLESRIDTMFEQERARNELKIASLKAKIRNMKSDINTLKNRAEKMENKIKEIKNKDRSSNISQKENGNDNDTRQQDNTRSTSIFEKYDIKVQTVLTRYNNPNYVRLAIGKNDIELSEGESKNGVKVLEATADIVRLLDVKTGKERVIKRK